MKSIILFIEEKAKYLLLLFSFFLIVSSAYSQNGNSKLVGYMGKRFLFNGYVNANFIPYSAYTYIDYNPNGNLALGISTALNLEGEYIINRRFGLTLGTMSTRFAFNDIEGIPDREGDELWKIKGRSIYLGVKNYLRREGGLAPVGFYQHLRVQKMYSNLERFALKGGDFVSTGATLKADPTTMICYGVGSNFGFGFSPLFTVGADFILPFNGDTFQTENAYDHLVISFRVGVVMPLF